MATVKIAIIGGGSPYMTSMFASLAQYAKAGTLAGCEVVLMDVNPVTLAMMTAWGNAGAANDHIPLTFRQEPSLEKALEGADFVLTCIRPGGGLEARYFDESIPLKYGELGNETVGVGGVFMALRTIPHILEITAAVRKVCPNAWLVHYTNPTLMVVEASVRAGHARTLGLCDGVWGVKNLATKLLKLPPTSTNDIDAYVAGINHHTWALGLEYRGRDLYREMDQLIAATDLSGKAGYEVIDENPLLNEVQADACRLYQTFGILPGTVFYARYYYHLKKLLQHHLSPTHQFRSQWLMDLRESKFAEIRRQQASGLETLLPYDLEDASHGDQAISAINAIANDTGLIEAVIRPNHGAVTNLPNDAVVEVTCRLQQAGPLSARTYSLPTSVQGMVQAAQISASLTVDAALTHDRRLVLQAAMAHPAHREMSVMEQIVAELFEAHRQWLPQFKS